MAHFERAIDKTLAWEGGYVNDPKDPGGETKYGISKRAHPDVDIKNLSREKACAIYKKHYWDPVLADKIESQTKAEKIFDIGVNTGVRRTSKFAQAAAGLSDKSLDGFIGKQSVQAINKTSDELFMLRLTVLQVAHYTNICKKSVKNMGGITITRKIDLIIGLSFIYWFVLCPIFL